MTFDLTADHQLFCARAREVAARVDDAMAHAIDEQGAIPEAIRQAVAESVPDPFAKGAVGAVLVVEELAVASAGLAAAVGLGAAAGTTMAESAAWPGLRGAERAVAVAGQSSGASLERARLVVCAVAVGVGRAAVSHALASMKTRDIRAGGDERTPHWTLADAATEIDGARLLTVKAAQMLERGEAASAALALAREFAAGAAARAVDAAIKVSGPAGYQRGSLLERLSRDATTLSLILTHSGT